MYPARSTCPVCGSQMVVTHLECRQCGSHLSGSFELPLLSRLSASQLHFVEVMIKHRGSIKSASDELGIAYNVGRTQLDEIIAALGFEPDAAEDDSGLSPDERQKVLKDLAEGRITSDEAIKRLRGRT